MIINERHNDQILIQFTSKKKSDGKLQVDEEENYFIFKLMLLPIQVVILVL